MNSPLLDAHLHLQDPRLRPHLPAIAAELRRLGVARWVVSGTHETDWPEVARLASDFPEVMPCYGLHPWHVAEKSDRWEESLTAHLSQPGVAAIGEIGLDKWIRDHDIAAQDLVFRRQIRLANSARLPVVIHCLKAWGRLREVLRDDTPEHGFLLHSFAGPAEMVAEFTELGGFFSFSGHFLHERKAEVLETFRRRIPVGRILVETDAPDMRLPESLESVPLVTQSGEAINHPANLPAVYLGLAAKLGMPLAVLAAQVAENFGRLFRFAGAADRR